MLEIGKIVKSTSGRDKDRLFFVVKIINDGYVLIVDGDLRKLEKPKLKKVKHLKDTSLISKDLQQKISNDDNINDAYLRNELCRLKGSD